MTKSGGSAWPAGVHFEIGYAGDAVVPALGGLSQETVYLDNLDLLLNLDLHALLNAGKTTVRLHVQSNRGSSISSRVGDLQGISNIEAPSEWRLYEAWVEFNSLPGRLSLLAGVYDLNSEFDVIPAASDFLNSSFGFGPDYSSSGNIGPSTFPLTTLGARLKARPTRNLYLGLAVSDGSPGNPSDEGRSRFALGGGEGGLFAVEAGYTSRVTAFADTLAAPSRVQERTRRIGRSRETRQLRTKLAFGAWAYTRDFDVWGSDGSLGKSWGLYILGEHMLTRGPSGESGLSVFGRAGLANDEVNRLSSYLGGGLAYSGILPGRAEDMAGLAVAHARNGSPFIQAMAVTGPRFLRAETVLEITYKAQLNPYFQIQPDLQWVINPGMNPEINDALVVGIRGVAALELP